MSNENCNENAVAGHVHSGACQTKVLSASSLAADDVYNPKGEKLGSIKEIMLDIHNGTVSYAVMSFGGFLSLGEKLFAVPWDALKVDTENKRFVFDADEDRLKEAPGFDTDHWPDMADASWAKGIHSYYAAQPAIRTDISAM